MRCSPEVKGQLFWRSVEIAGTPAHALLISVARYAFLTVALESPLLALAEM